MSWNQVTEDTRKLPKRTEQVIREAVTSTFEITAIGEDENEDCVAIRKYTKL